MPYSNRSHTAACWTGCVPGQQTRHPNALRVPAEWRKSLKTAADLFDAAE